jgi:hypothetical protein
MRPIFWSLHGIVAGTDRRIGIAEKSLSKMELSAMNRIMEFDEWTFTAELYEYSRGVCRARSAAASSGDREPSVGRLIPSPCHAQGQKAHKRLGQ